MKKWIFYLPNWHMDMQSMVHPIRKLKMTQLMLHHMMAYVLLLMVLYQLELLQLLKMLPTLYCLFELYLDWLQVPHVTKDQYESDH